MNIITIKFNISRETKNDSPVTANLLCTKDLLAGIVGTDSDKLDSEIDRVVLNDRSASNYYSQLNWSTQLLIKSDDRLDLCL